MQKVVVIYNDEMTKHKAERDHVENPKRITTVFYAIKPLLNQCTLLTGRTATTVEIAAIHSMNYLQRVGGFKNDGFGDMYGHINTLSSALYAAGSCCQLAEQMELGNCGFAIVRPPGHHACSCQWSGFCFFNNVLIAAHKLLPKKVWIVDIDVHFGDGTVSILRKKQFPNIRYISIHRFDDGQFYPGKSGKYKDTDMITSIPFSGPQGDEFYLEKFKEIIVPKGKEFEPDYILVSAGFDAAAGDPLGGCFVSPQGYFQMITMLKEIQPKIGLVLEGGYDLDNGLPLSAKASLEALL